jgi:cell division septum initiation protein DivIVA
MTTTEPTVAFTSVRKGYDPGEVDAHIRFLHEQLADKDVDARALSAEMEQRLKEASQREEAVHLMLVAATKTKEEMTDAARRQLEESDSEARTQADKILSEARYEAFRLVTEARAEADTALEKAKTEANDALATAREEAQTIISTARREALEILATAQGDATQLVDASDKEKERLRAELAAEHTELAERVERLRAVAHELETRLQSLASAALGDLDGLLSEAASIASDGDSAPDPSVPPAPPATTEPEVDAAGQEPVAETLEPPARPGEPAFTGGGMPLIEPVIPVHREPANETPTPAVAHDHEPTVADVAVDAVEEEPIRAEAAVAETASEELPAPAEAEERSLTDRIIEEETTDTSWAGKPRGSFYSRRSAKLPRIGEEAGKGALAAVSAMRERMTDAGDEEDEDLAMQTA